MLEAPNWDDYIDAEVTRGGSSIGTVVDYDRDAGEVYLEPSGEVDVNTWKSLGWHTGADYDGDWDQVDYDAWRSGGGDLTVDYDEWPFTLPADRLADGEDGLELAE